MAKKIATKKTITEVKVVETPKLIYNSNELTLEDYNKLVQYREAYSYSTSQANEMIDLGRKYVDGNMKYCGGCRNNLGEAKLRIFGWFTAEEPKIREYFNL